MAAHVVRQDVEAGDGGVEAAAVTPEPLNQIGTANLPFTVG
jgi:hypothetical protein